MASVKDRLYVVYGDDDRVYIVKARNKKEAIKLAYNEFGYLEFGFNPIKKNYVALDLEKECFKRNGRDRKVANII